MIRKVKISRKLSSFLVVVFALVAFFEICHSTAAASKLFGDEEDSERPIVQIAQGALEGVWKHSRNGRPYSAFQGIPFGESERFEDPQPANGWKGTRDASNFGAPCIQNNIFSGKVEGSEDCLFLNVFSPKVSNRTSSNFPSMVFSHGGRFEFGSGAMTGGKYFLDEDVILITINYRLGPFGFANTGFGANFGLKDQILALKWVKQNIQQFGGNPNSVTIFGESAGAYSVSALILSPLAKGLFHRAISQSGVAHSPFGIFLDPAREFRKLGILMDCPISNREYLTQCLKRIDPVYMLKRLKSAAALPEFRPDDIPYFLPSVDKDSKDGASVVFPDTFLNLLKRGEFAQVPWISGVNSLEGWSLFPRTMELRNTTRNSWNELDARALTFDEHDCKGLEKIRQFYIVGTQSQIADPSIIADNVTNLFSDRYFVHPAKVSAVLHAKHAPAYLFHFAFKSTVTFLGDLNPSDSKGLKRPTHLDEMQYLFDMTEEDVGFPEISADSKYAPFSNYFVKLWVSFAKAGSVALENLASPWTPLSNTSKITDNVDWFEIDTNSKMTPESDIWGSRVKFWNHLVGEG